MILFVAIIFLIAAAVFLTVRYLKINAKVLSKDSFDRAARDKAQELEYEDPVITCDYCGNKIDTSKYTECPVCGGTYDSDSEWIRRHYPDMLWADYNAAETAKRKVSQAERESAPTRKKLKKVLGILGGIGVFFILIGVIFYLVGDEHPYRENEQVNQYSYDKYIKENYTVEGDGVLLEEAGLRVRITGIYRDSDGVGQGMKMEYTVENTTDEDLQLCYELFGVNGYCREGCLNIVYDWYKKNSTTTYYESMYAMGDIDVINSLVYGHFYINNGDEERLYESETLRKFKTTAEKDGMISLPAGDAIYQEQGITINRMMGEKGYVFWIENGTDHDYKLTSTDLKIDGKDYDTSRILRSVFPAHHVFKSDDVYAYSKEDTEALGDELEDLKDGRNVQISFEFDCEQDPAAGFKTGYITLNTL